MATTARRARSFGALAGRYDAIRPGYPPDAVDAALPAGAAVVADVGAGTGKLTALLLERGVRVVAVEPDPRMRSVLAERAPAAEIRDGVAEALPLGDGEVDGVCFAQSWHWVDPRRGPAEVVRVLRPGGQLSLLWNLEDQRSDWVAALSALTRGTAAVDRRDGMWEVEGLCAGHRRDVSWSYRLPRARVVELVSTWSAVSTRSDSARRDVLSAVTRLMEDVPGVYGTDEVDLPQICALRWFHRAGECP